MTQHTLAPRDPLSGAAYDAGSDWTAAPAAPPPDPNLRLRPRTNVSFDVSDPELLARWLQSAGWRPLPGRSPSEHSRLVHGRQLVVVYSRSALIQGCCVDQTVALLNVLV